MPGQPVVVGRTLGGRLISGAQPLDDRTSIDDIQVSRVAVDIDQQVPVLVELLRDRTEVLQGDPAHECPGEGGLQRGIIEELVCERGPAVVESNRRTTLVEHIDRRWQTGLEGVGGKDSLGKTVERTDRRAVDLLEGSPGSCLSSGQLARGGGLAVEPVNQSVGTKSFVIPGRGLLERFVDAVAQLRRGRLGERDGGDPTQPDAARRHQREHTPDQRRRLPGAGAGFDEERPVELGQDLRSG